MLKWLSALTLAHMHNQYFMCNGNFTTVSSHSTLCQRWNNYTSQTTSTCIWTLAYICYLSLAFYYVLYDFILQWFHTVYQFVESIPKFMLSDCILDTNTIKGEWYNGFVCKGMSKIRIRLTALPPLLGLIDPVVIFHCLAVWYTVASQKG